VWIGVGTRRCVHRGVGEVSFDEVRKDDEADVDLPPELVPEKPKKLHIASVVCPGCEAVIAGSRASEADGKVLALCGERFTAVGITGDPIKFAQRTGRTVCEVCMVEAQRALIEHRFGIR
jgi:hypothetical protein